MLRETGWVVSIEADGLWVETEKKSTCAQCSAKFGCGQRLLSERGGRGLTRVKAFFSSDQKNLSHWFAGDMIEIGIDERAFLLGSLVAYTIPLLCMVGFLVCSAKLGSNELMHIVAAISGLFFGGLISRVHARRNRSNHYYNAQVLSESKIVEIPAVGINVAEIPVVEVSSVK
ncbi:MAG: sigma-E factor negative regulatory protein RseC [Flavobacteriales bacterium]